MTYLPDETTLTPLLQRFSDQVSRIVIVDNTPKNDDRLAQQLIRTQFALDQFAIVRLGDNLGIATALNVGIEIARSEGAEFVVLSDQDSLPAADMVPNLLAAYRTLTADGIRVGAVGPTFADLHTELTYPFQAHISGKFFYGHMRPVPEAPQIEAITLITSGTLIPLTVFDEVGTMREDFFIDHVDIEWCHRARAHGYRIYGTGWARMAQRMGDERLRVWYGRWHDESAYNPLRIYYRLRNFVALLRLDYIDWRWKTRNSLYWAKTIYAHTLFGKQKNKSLHMALKGIWHGLRGRMGRY
ncbi:MAG: glycosyltransferase family 2 protein [Halothiobacillus sp.]